MSPDLHFATRAELLAWLDTHGLAHLARLNLEAAAPHLDRSLWPQLRMVGARRRLVDLGSTDGVTRAAEWAMPAALLAALPPAIAAVLEAARTEAEEARAEPRPDHAAPADPVAREVHGRLLALRATFPSGIAPRPARLLDPHALSFDAALPGFRFKDLLPTEVRLPTTGAFVRPEARLGLAPGATQLTCTCGTPPCVHVLAAVDLALRWLHQPLPPARHRALAALVRPPWEHTLAALDAALSEAPEARAGFELAWHVSITEPAGVEVGAVVHRLGKDGRPGPGTRVTRRRLLTEHGPRLGAVDARVAALLPDGPGFASRAALECLVGHPRVVLAERPDRAVVVERTTVGIVAEARARAVRLTAGVDGAPVPAPLADRLRTARPEDVLFLWDGRRITLLDLKPELRAMLGVLHAEGDLFPPEGQAALLDALARWSVQVPVAMPRTLAGEAVPPDNVAVVRLQGRPAGAIEVELRVRPLDGGPSFVPGRGPRDVHVRAGDRVLHAVRDLDAERRLADAVCVALPLDGAERGEEPFTFRVEDPETALDLLAACGAVTPPPQVEWIGPPRRVAGRVGPRALTVRVVRGPEWFGVLGGLDVDGHRVELARLLDTHRRRERWVEVEADTWVEVDAALRRHLEALADHVYAERTGLHLAPSATRLLDHLAGDGVHVDTDAAWRRVRDRAHAAGDLDPDPPPGLTATLRPYQREGFRWMFRLAAWGAGGILADDMGLGKTVQALALLVARAGDGPALVVAPTSVTSNWVDEARRFTPDLRVVLYADSPDRAAAVRDLGAGDVLIVPYGLLVADITALVAAHFATVLFDEAQNLKNAHTRRARAGRALRADVKFGLTGTPVENHVGELWSLYAVLFPGLLGSWESFLSRFGRAIEGRVDPEAAPALARVVAPFLLRRTKAQVATQLPPRVEVRVPVVLSADEWQLYEDARLATLSDLERTATERKEQERRIDVLAALTRLRLLAAHPRLYDPASLVPSSKLARLLELVDELVAEGQRALVFSQFTSYLSLVRAALDSRGVAYGYLDGQTPRGERAAQVRAFQDGVAPLFLLSLKAGGVGLNLTAASNVVLLDPWWNPAVEDQAADRSHRLGQTRTVTIYRLVALGTVEEQMLQLHADKRDLVARVLDGSDRAGALGTAELVALLAGRTDPGR